MALEATLLKTTGATQDNKTTQPDTLRYGATSHPLAGSRRDESHLRPLLVGFELVDANHGEALSAMGGVGIQGFAERISVSA